METFESIFDTIESIKKKHSNFKIKLALIKVDDINIRHQKLAKLVELVSTYNVLQLDLGKVWG